MSDSTKTTRINDLLAKTRTTNHLATPLEKQAAAGAMLSKPLMSKYRYLQYHTQLLRNALTPIFDEKTLRGCYVIYVSPTELTLSLDSPTAANHARYIMEDCVQALRTYDQRFCHLQSIKFITSPNLLPSDARPVAKKTLSENTRQMITQNIKLISKNPHLIEALQKLASED